jgi:hypothetical protein
VLHRGRLLPSDVSFRGGGRWIRTTEGVSQQIYSLPPLAAWVSLRNLSCFFVATSQFLASGRWITSGVRQPLLRCSTSGIHAVACPPPLRGRAAFASRSFSFPPELGRTAPSPGQLHEYPLQKRSRAFSRSAGRVSTAKGEPNATEGRILADRRSPAINPEQLACQPVWHYSEGLRIRPCGPSTAAV